MQDLLLEGVAPMAHRYRAWACDIWGVVHNGVEAYQAAVDALTRYRAQGGAVALITNAPRPSGEVAQQLDAFGVPADAYDTIVTSGDVTRTAITEEGAALVYHLGPERDAPLYQGLAIELVDIGEADSILCTGLFDDETEGPEDYEEVLEEASERDLVMFCANPDKVVQRGDHLIYCAGALAEAYEAFGGRVIYAGKPHAPIYQLALTRLEEFCGTKPGAGEILVIGDGADTDLAGAAAQGFSALFVTGGIHADELDGTESTGSTESHDARARFLTTLQEKYPALKLVGVQPRLVW